MELIWCPPGAFVMGPDGFVRDSPAHEVILTKGFYLGKYEVTQEEYEKIMGNNPSKFKGAKLPVEKVSWENAVQFCETLTKKNRTRRGWRFTLPTEAEWEYAAHAGTRTKFSWGPDVTPKMANYIDSGINKTTDVGSYRPNPWGFFDMSGNVDEWCSDWIGPYVKTKVTDPTGPEEGQQKARRGGSWRIESGRIRPTDRSCNTPSKGGELSSGGFRVALKRVD